MSQWRTDWDDVPVQLASETSINMNGQKQSKPVNDENMWPQLQRELWPLVDYDRSEVKSPQELLFEAAWETDLGKKWNLFEMKTKPNQISRRKLKKLISTLDDERHWAALHYAVECNNVELSRKLTSKREPYQCDVNILGGNGENVLHVASRTNLEWSNNPSTKEPPPLIKLLIDELGADVNHADDEGRTPLHLAVMRGQRLYADYLIYRGAKVDVLTKLNASVLHFALFPGNTMSPVELRSIIELIMKELSVKRKYLFNLCTLDNRSPLVFLASHPAIASPPSIGKKEEHQARKDLMKLFTNDIKDKKQILVTFDLIARRNQLQQFDHLQPLVTLSSPEIRAQILHIVCRHDNAAFLKWLMKQEELKEHLNTADYAGYTPLLTATFYKSEKCVKELIEVCFYFLLSVIHEAVIEQNSRYNL